MPDKPGRQINVPKGSRLSEWDYRDFLNKSYEVLSRHAHYFAVGEGLDSLELAHLIPEVDETVLAVYLGINDAVCNKGLVSPFLIRHGHNAVFVFEPDVYSGGDDVPVGTVDAQEVLRGFEPPNETWDAEWTYVMIADVERTAASLWQENGYIDMIPAKLEDFTMLSSLEESKVCFYIDAGAFEHPVNKERKYLREARRRAEKTADEFGLPTGLEGEVDGLEPVVLDIGEKLYVVRLDSGPCEHAWSNLHEDNSEPAVVNENSAVSLDMVVGKPAVKHKYATFLRPPKGSSDLTTDWFYRGRQVMRAPLLSGLVKG